MKIYNSMLKITLLAVLSSACAAQYQTIKNPEAAGTQNPTDDATPNLDEPQAGVEILYEKRVVVKVPVGIPFVIRPTTDTMDLDDKDVADCRNPGIISANYNIEGYSESALRDSDECSDLGITYTASEKGPLLVSLEVESNENEIATASIEIEVVDLADMPPPNDEEITNGSNNGGGSSDTDTQAGNNDTTDGGSSSTDTNGNDEGSSTTGGSNNNTGGSNNGGSGSTSTDSSKGDSTPGQHTPGQSPQQSK